TGSNLLRGVVSTLLKHYKFNGLESEKVGLWEIDEAVLPSAIEKIKPKVVVLTNLFRDQLDRYGEIDTLVKKWKQALKKLSVDTILILNADDPAIAALGSQVNCQVYFYGIKDTFWGSNIPSHASDATFCPKCLHPLIYDKCFVSHLGIYQCQKCGKIQPKTDIWVEKIDFVNKHIKLKISMLKKSYTINANLMGVYNAYNLVAAFTAAHSLNISPQDIIKGCANFKPAFGRLEQVKYKDKDLNIMLVKNPTGFNQVIDTLAYLTKKSSFSCLLVLNDLIADGRDVSWIWDVDMENLTKLTGIKYLVISGLRAEDLSLRVKYTNFKGKIKLENNLEKAIDKFLKLNEKKLYILPTYTAMLNLRKILNRKGLVHSTWKD
ncbi:MurT ligase domain-containing protein, partial [Patescibacteria group bacterium]